MIDLMVFDLYQNHICLPSSHSCFKIIYYLNYFVSKWVNNEIHLCVCVCTRVYVYAQSKEFCLIWKSTVLGKKKKERKLHDIM